MMSFASCKVRTDNVQCLVVLTGEQRRYAENNGIDLREYAKKMLDSGSLIMEEGETRVSKQKFRIFKTMAEH